MPNSLWEERTLKAIAALCFLPHNIQHRVDELCTLCVVALGPVVACAGLQDHPSSVHVRKTVRRAHHLFTRHQVSGRGKGGKHWMYLAEDEVIGPEYLAKWTGTH